MKHQVLLRLRTIALLAGSVALAGCQPAEENREHTYPVTGTLYVNGKPAAGAMVKLYQPGGNGRMPTAIVQDDGQFSVSYYDTEDGAPVGEYQMLVIWMVPPSDGGMPVDCLQGRFANPNEPIRRIEVQPAANSLEPIHLRAQTITP